MSDFFITSAGLLAASTATPTGPYIEITEFRLGTDTSTSTLLTSTGLYGTTVYSASPTSYTILDIDTIGIQLDVPATAGNFSFGEIGLFLSSGVMFARASLGKSVSKVSSNSSSSPNILRYTAVVKLTQAPAIFQITTSTGDSILEVSDFSVVQGPSQFLGSPNALIVNETSPYQESVFLWKQSSTRWSIGKYNRVTSAILASNQSGSFLLDSTDFLPFQTSTPSKYLIQTTSGAVRAVADISGSQLTLTKALAPSLVLGDVVDLYEVDSKSLTPPIISRSQYNDLASFFNSVWSTPAVASSFKDSMGFGQTAIPLLPLGASTTSLDLDNLSSAIQSAANLVGYSMPSTSGINPDWSSNLTDYATKLSLLYSAVSTIKQSRFNIPVENLSLTLGTQTTYTGGSNWTSISYAVSFIFTNSQQMAAFFNSGGILGFTPDIQGANFSQKCQSYAFNPLKVVGTSVSRSGCLVGFGDSSSYGDGFSTSSSELGYYGLTSTNKVLYRKTIFPISNDNPVHLILEGKITGLTAVTLTLSIEDQSSMATVAGVGVAKCTPLFYSPSSSILPSVPTPTLSILPSSTWV